ncbi:hypothetical protein NUW58_g10843 [Xylaria curta]|uniref:Uncharacterized protein n=1 Tax=Xylaria curta TaxID=42375 RepID=A0ACC1MH48_9PEZI|nr:hypothetical protein NUW58_g10843 [Xylaria curta]
MRNTLRSRSSLEPSARITTSSPHLPTNLSRHQRPFSSCRSLYNKKARTLPPTTTPPHKSPTSGPLADKIKALSYAQRLAMKPQPTTLYEAAPHMGFLISSYGASFFCFGSAAINSWFNVFNIPPGISSWAPVGFGVVSFVKHQAPRPNASC